jgi:rubrerythrin
MSAGKATKTRARKAGGRRATSARDRKKPAAKKPSSTVQADFLARAWAMEVEAAERYAMFADAMDEHNNRDVAELFRKLARIEQLHADQLLEENLSRHPPVLPAGGVRWDGGEGPETGAPGDLHYRMQPYHALQIALACEKRANKFFADVAGGTTDARVRKLAREMAGEEAEHVRLIEDWLKRTPPPDKDWERDPDPPVVSD